jgi:hypothetical protein
MAAPSPAEPALPGMETKEKPAAPDRKAPGQDEGKEVDKDRDAGA